MLHTVFVTHNRIALTRIAIETWLETAPSGSTYVVVDNASTDGTAEWLCDAEHPCLLLRQNFYPGYACNRGWEQAPESARFLQRADNDFAFLEGWWERVLEEFIVGKVGQVGLRTGPEELGAPWNVGGNCIVRRELWDQGLRYEEKPWSEYPPGFSEDSFFSPAVKKMGYTWTRVKKPCIVSLASGDWDDPYYAKSYGDRRIPRPS